MWRILTNGNWPLIHQSNTVVGDAEDGSMRRGTDVAVWECCDPAGWVELTGTGFDTRTEGRTVPAVLHDH